jgi:hypothetical protein
MNVHQIQVFIVRCFKKYSYFVFELYFDVFIRKKTKDEKNFIKRSQKI